jgi:hypothetical protein
MEAYNQPQWSLRPPSGQALDGLGFQSSGAQPQPISFTVGAHTQQHPPCVSTLAKTPAGTARSNTRSLRVVNAAHAAAHRARRQRVRLPQLFEEHPKQPQQRQVDVAWVLMGRGRLNVPQLFFRVALGPSPWPLLWSDAPLSPLSAQGGERATCSASAATRACTGELSLRSVFPVRCARTAPEQSTLFLCRPSTSADRRSNADADDVFSQAVGGVETSSRMQDVDVHHHLAQASSSQPPDPTATPSRTLLVRNVAADADDEELSSIFKVGRSSELGIAQRGQLG